MNELTISIPQEVQAKIHYKNHRANNDDGRSETGFTFTDDSESTYDEELPTLMSLPRRHEFDTPIIKPQETTSSVSVKKKKCHRSSPEPPELDWSFLEEGHLFGRQQELEALRKAFHRRLSPQGNPPELILVSGTSGSGKTALVNKAFQELVHTQNGFFIQGKFDCLQTPEPFAPFAAALTLLALELEQRTANICELRERILREVGLEYCHVLCALAPGLLPVLQLHQDSTGASALKTHDAQQNRLKLALNKFFQTLCSPKMPIALVLDDLQWADSASLDLLEALASGMGTSEGLIIVGLCRSNEVEWHHNFSGMLRRLEDESVATIAHVEVGSLSVAATNSLVSDMLQQPMERCLPLAKIIHDTTGGNAFHMLQMIKELHHEGVLLAERVREPGPYAFEEEQDYEWVWHDDQWDDSFRGQSDAVTLVTAQMKRIPEPCQNLLKIAASIGAEFDAAIMAAVLGEEPLSELLARSVKERMIIELTHMAGRYAFVHDQIQKAAYNLIPDGQRPAMHLAIGKSLFQQLSPKKLEKHLFLVANQLVLGMSLLDNEMDKNGLAELCVRAGKKASRSSDFDTALAYYDVATDLLPKRHWRDEYHLSLELYNSKAETQCSSSSFEAMDATVEEVLTNSRTNNDKLRAYTTKIYSLGIRSNFSESIQLGLEVMKTLGEKFPSRPSMLNLIPEFLMIKRRLGSKTDEDILNLPNIDSDDRDKMAAMSILDLLKTHVFCSEPDWVPFFVIRFLKLTLKYGLCDLSCLAFASYGTILCAVGETDEGYRYGQLSLKLFQRCPHSRLQLLPRLYFQVYGMLAPWRDPLRSTLDSLYLSISASMESGDFECTMFSSYTYIAHRLSTGEPLPAIESLVDKYVGVMSPHQGPWLSLTLLLRNYVNGYTGKTADNPLSLSGGDMDPTRKSKREFIFYESAKQNFQLQIAYHFGDIELALSCARRCRLCWDSANSSFVMCIFYYFYDAMTALEAAHFGKRRRRMRRARHQIQKIAAAAKQCPSNVVHQMCLLQGELQTLKGNLAAALGYYFQAMEHAEKASIICMHGLAYERSAIAYQRLCKGPEKEREFKRFMNRAIDYYKLWGATALVDCLREKHKLC